MNSRTSRPRSPTSASTTVSNPSLRASIASSVDLPTPEPAKMPTRWPAQIGANRSMTRTPVRSGLWTRARLLAAGAERVEAAALPARTGRKGQRRHPVGDRADAAGELTVERLGDDALAVDPHH